MNDFNAQLYSGIALQNADEMTGNNAKDKLLAYLGTEAGTQLLAQLFKTKFNQPKLPKGNPSLNASPSEFFGFKNIQDTPQPLMQPKLVRSDNLSLYSTPQQFFDIKPTSYPTSTVQSTQSVSTQPTTPQLGNQNLSLNSNFEYTATPSQGGMNQAVQNATSNLTSSSTQNTSTKTPIFSKDSLISGGAGIAGGAVGQFAGNKLGGLLFDSNTKEGAFASGLLGQAGSTVAATAASNLASSGSLSLSGIGSAASIGQGAMGVANIALDAFDPVKKSKGENIAGLGLGAVGAAAALASVPVAGWIAGGALLATNIIGHAFGKKSNSFTMDKELYSEMGGSYGGSMYKAQDAMAKANQKYSAFNEGARQRANWEILEAKRQQNLVTDISEEATDRRNIAQYMSAFNGNRRGFQLQGGYNQSSIHAAKNGIKIEKLNKAKEILKSLREEQTNQLQKGGEIKLDDFEYYLSTLPENQRDSTNFRVKDYWIFNGKPKDFQEAINREMFSQQEDFDDNGKSLGFSWHANTIAWNPETGEGEFMKSPNHKTIQKEIDWYNSKDGENFRRQYTLVKSTPYWKYVKKHEGGGSIIKIISDIEMFQKGGITPVKTRTLEELIEYAKQKNPRFIQRMSEPIRDIDLGNGYRGTHRLAWATTDNPNEAIVYPEIFENAKGELIYDPEHAFDNAKKGDALFMTPDEAELFTKQYKKGWPNFFNKFQKGGTINVIPEGALHARKNNMDMDDITKKGIPVVDKEGEQQAEIERNEVILRLEVTQKLEELSKIYYSEESSEEEKEQAALDAGKLLSDEILYNTQDNTGLLNGNKK